MLNTDVFDTQYERLNPAQKQAVDTVEGPVMVIAGPGTGKTTVLTLRIANILRVTDSDPDAILALTFTESGVASMRTKLVEIIGSAAYKVHIHTFHGFCNEVIKRSPDSFPRIIGASNVTEVDQIRILKRIFEGTTFSHIKPYGSPYHYLRPALGAIRNLKREGVSVDDFRKRIDEARDAFDAVEDKHHTKGKYKGTLKGAYRDQEKHLNRNEELLRVYESYEMILTEERLYDFEDMVLEVVNRLESDEDLRLRLQEQFQYILADEHQDANTAQNKLLEALASFYESPNLFIVGDEKQAIFRFQGASLDNFLYFTKRFPEATVISLKDNYRSHQEILDSAHSLITGMTAQDDVEASLRIPLAAFHGASGENIGIYEFSHPDREYQFIARDIEEKIREGVDPGEIAVIYRDNKDAYDIAYVLEGTDIPFTIQSSQNILDDEDIQKLLLLFRAVAHLDRDDVLVQVLFVDFLGINPLDAYTLSRMRAEKKAPLMKMLADDTKLKDADLQDIERVHKLKEKLLDWSVAAHNHSFLDVFERIVRESGFLAHVLKAPGSAGKLHKLEGLFEEARQAALSIRERGVRTAPYTLHAFLAHIDLIEEHNVKLSLTEDVLLKNTVHLMTAHKSKGLEFDHVYIIGATDDHWGNRRVGELFKLPLSGDISLESTKLDDERRLFYVALTRARKSVSVTYATSNTEGRQRIRTQFLEEIDSAHRTEKDTKDIEARIKETHAETRFKERRPQGIDVSEKAFLNKLFADQGMSVTALNNYLTCPWQYFFLNLLRVPQAPGRSQKYGTAIHEALHRFFNHYKKNRKGADEAQLLTYFTEELETHGFSDVEYEEMLEKGIHALSGYYKAHHTSWQTHIRNEYQIKGILLPIDDGDVRLRGTLDKVEIGQDGRIVTVVDYKTGKPQTRNHIEGNTKTSNGNYLRQLIFYKILVDRSEAGRYIMTQGVIDFIEPDTRGKYHTERFEITDSDVAALENTIQEVSRDIVSLSFWDTMCDQKDCKYCALRKMMQ